MGRKNIWNNLKVWLACAAGAGSMMLGNEGKGDRLDVANMDGIGGNGIGGSVLVEKHVLGADEYSDGNDLSWSSMPPNPDPKWLKVYTEPYSTDLETDGRPP